MDHYTWDGRLLSEPDPPEPSAMVSGTLLNQKAQNAWDDLIAHARTDEELPRTTGDVYTAGFVEGHRQGYNEGFYAGEQLAYARFTAERRLAHGS